MGPAQIPLVEGVHYRVSPSGCWEWLRAKVYGYGEITVNYKNWRAHRLSYTIFRGPIPPGMMVCHSCDNHACVNPSHLWLGTQADNIQDAINKGRQVRGETHGEAKLTPEQVRYCRQAARAGVPSKDLAHQFGVVYMTIYRIVTGRSWRHLV